MSARRLATLVALAVGGFGLLAVLLLPWSRPFDVNVLSVATANMIDRAGRRVQLVTLSIRNRGNRRLVFASKAKAEVTNRWLDVEVVAFRPIHAQGVDEILLLMPSASGACRLRFQFNCDGELLSYQLAKLVGRHGAVTGESEFDRATRGWTALQRASPALCRWLGPTQPRYYAEPYSNVKPRHWSTTTVALDLPHEESTQE
jgi:hypothetical protein